MIKKITFNYAHYCYKRMTELIMLSLEFMKILKKHFVHNMISMFVVCKYNPNDDEGNFSRVWSQTRCLVLKTNIIS
jgi:hypothetical protein